MHRMIVNGIRFVPFTRHKRRVDDEVNEGLMVEGKKCVQLNGSQLSLISKL
jgi:hypothetical protein